MENNIYSKIKERIEQAEQGYIFVTSDFKDLASNSTVRKYLSRQVEENKIRRIMDGIYEKPRYSKILKSYLHADPEKIAKAIARNFHWTIAPCGDIALNKLVLSTQVPVVWSYISDGPYRNFSWDNFTISFKHRSNRGISYMSKTTTLVVEAFRTLGKNRIDEIIIKKLKHLLPKEEKQKMLNEAKDTAEWIYSAIKKVCY